jgi:hypothetical protein
LIYTSEHKGTELISQSEEEEIPRRVREMSIENKGNDVKGKGENDVTRVFMMHVYSSLS